MNRTFAAAVALTLSTVSLAACSGGAEEAPAAQDAGIPGLNISNARMMLGPVAGNPAAIYMDIAYDGDRNIAIRSASVEGASRAELHDFMEYNFEQTMGEMAPLMLRPGDSASFAPGAKHIMAFDVSPELKAGDTAKVTLTIAGGASQTFDVPVMAAGDAR